ncbi:MAG: hypothetical protein ACTHU0_23355 [Kofleriaceae bacterium]
MRLVSLCALLAAALAGCGRDARPADPPSELAPVFGALPAQAEVAVRVDLTRARAWSKFEKAAPVALQLAEPVLEIARRDCQLDPTAEASAVWVASRGAIGAGDLAVIVAGLPRAKLDACFAKRTADVAVDGDRVQLRRDGVAVASGVVLPSGTLVVISRGGRAVDPAAWKAELARPAAAPPAWWSELDKTAPLAVRIENPSRTVFAAVELVEPLSARGFVRTRTAETAKTEQRLANAVLEYLKQANAATGTLEVEGYIVKAQLTSAGPQVDQLLELVLPAVLDASSPGPNPEVATEPAPPSDCASLAGAVERYLGAAADRSDPATRDRLLGAKSKLQQAFVGTCTGDQWPAVVIECHIKHAVALAKFERCREGLSEPQRARFDQAVVSAMQ